MGGRSRPPDAARAAFAGLIATTLISAVIAWDCSRRAGYLVPYPHGPAILIGALLVYVAG
jgi:hypothetical protein